MADGLDGDSTHFHVGIGEAVIREKLGKTHARLHAGDLNAFLDDAGGGVVHFVADVRVFLRRALQNSADERIVHNRFGSIQNLLAKRRTHAVQAVKKKQDARGHFEQKICDGWMNERRERAKKRQESEGEAKK